MGSQGILAVCWESEKEVTMRVRRLLNLRRELVLAIAIPLVAKAISAAAQELRTRRGPSRAADRLDQAGQLLRRARRFV
jgi:hypothetical protein